MQTMVVISLHARDVDLQAGQPLVIKLSDSGQETGPPGADKTNRRHESTIDKEWAPAFWTWFVENPRPSRQSEPGRG